MVGYARVSTADQPSEGQVTRLRRPPLRPGELCPPPGHARSPSTTLARSVPCMFRIMVGSVRVIRSQAEPDRRERQRPRTGSGAAGLAVACPTALGPRYGQGLWSGPGKSGGSHSPAQTPRGVASRLGESAGIGFPPVGSPRKRQGGHDLAVAVRDHRLR